MKKKFILLSAVLVALVLHFQAVAQYINTVAGNGGDSYVGDHGQARNAEISWPQGVAFDKKGNLYIADVLNNVIRKVVPGGIISTVAGDGFEAGTGNGGYSGDGGAATAAHLFAPSGVCVDTNGFIYIADLANNAVRMVDTNGIIHTIAGTGVGGFAGDGGPASTAKLSEPTKVALDTFGNLYIVEKSNNCVRQVNPSTGVIISVAGNGLFPPGYTGDGGPATAAQMYTPMDIAIDQTGNLYIADEVNNVIRFVNMATTTIATLAGAGSAGFRGDGGSATTAQFFDPDGVALDDSGNLFVADYGNNRIRAIDLATGIISTVAGDGIEGETGDGGPATNAELWMPAGITTDVKGGLYIADMGNNRIRYLSTPITAVKNISTPPADLLIYPNPSNGNFSLYLPAAIQGQVSVVVANDIGIPVHEFVTSGNTLNNVSLKAPPGIYFVTVTTPGAKWTKQVTILNE